MVRKFVIVMGVLAVFLAANVLVAGAEAPAKPMKPKAAHRPPFPIRLEGTISVTKDANNVVTSIKLTTAAKLVYNVTLDTKGEELGKLDGKEVQLKCMVTEKDNQKWITVNEFQLVEKKKETPSAEPKSKPTPLKLKK
jgi:hypothetical protein